VLYFTLFRSKLGYASVVWNSVTFDVANKLERIQQKFASVCFYRLSPHCPYSYTVALEKLRLHSSRALRHRLIFFFFLFRPLVALNPALPSWKMLVFVSLLAMLRNSQCLALVPQIYTVLLLSAPMLPTWWVKIVTYLQSELFLLIIFYNFVLKFLTVFKAHVLSPYVHLLCSCYLLCFFVYFSSSLFLFVYFF
jgi:hypothetical protein